MIYFIRHGQSEANVRRVFAGQKDDSPLTEEGRNQARLTAQALKDKNTIIDKIVHSSLKRAEETALIIATELGYNIEDLEIDNRITEYDMGDLTSTPAREVTSRQLIVAPNAENVDDFHNRIHDFVEEIKHSNENILVVSHAGVGRMLEIMKTKGDKTLFYDLPSYPNASINELDWL
ncbi:histidine phosphatase family protein [Candidatus Parcubacteria bacterium]|nr:histidine phosphatase family protein [Candidatus Parcubacteria bacterium]